MSTFVDEFRGTDCLAMAEVLYDNNGAEGYVTGPVEELAPVAEIGKTTETSSDTKFYDNVAALTISGEGADTVTLSVPVLPLRTLAKITGKGYNEDLGVYTDGETKKKYYALGYRLKLTDGTYRYVWRYKGTFAIPDETSQTENAGTDSQGQSLTYTGISTIHKFANAKPIPNSKQKALVVDERDGIADLTDFFGEVKTCDTITAKTSYTLSITQATGTTVTVKRNGVTLTTADKIYAGDVLTITCTGGTMTVNGTAFTSGGTHTVAANVAVVSTATSQ